MALEWIQENQPTWDADKIRIIGGAPTGAFDRRYKELKPGTQLSGDWWKAVDKGKTVGFGWLDIVFGDAEILLATEAVAQGKGVGTFILENLSKEAAQRGLNYVYNVVRPSHPDKERVSAFLKKRGFQASEDGSLLRSAASKVRAGH